MNTHSQLEAMRWLAFRNDSGETIPPFAVMRITGASKDDTTGVVFLRVAKPNATAEKSYLINGPTRVLSGAYGSGTFEPTMALYDSSDGTPAMGEFWGPKSGQWTLEKNAAGYVVLGGNIVDAAPRVFVREYRTQTSGIGQLYAPGNYTASSRAKITWSGAYPYINATPSTTTDDITLDSAGTWRATLSLHVKGSNTSQPTQIGAECLVQIERTRGGLIVAAKGVHCLRLNSQHPFIDIECCFVRDDYEAGDVLTAYMTCTENVTMRDGSFEVARV